MEREKWTQFITQWKHRFVENRNASFPATTYHLLHTLVTCGQIVDDCWIMFDKLLGNLQTCFAGVVDYLWTLVGRLLDDFRMTCSTFNLKGLKEKLNPTSPLGYRWFRSSFNQNTSSPYPLPGPPIRPPWISRGRTSLSPNNIKHPARASKSATLIGGSFLYVRTFAGRLWGWEKTIEHKLHLFSYLFNYASGRASPGSIENCKILANNPSPRTGPR